MAEGNGHKPKSEVAEEFGGTCEGCEVPVTANCESCGMPMMSPQQHGGGDTENKYCIHCCRTDGSLKSYEEVLEGMAGLIMNTRGLGRAAAESAARQYLATMPAWCDR